MNIQCGNWGYRGWVVDNDRQKRQQWESWGQPRRRWDNHCDCWECRRREGGNSCVGCNDWHDGRGGAGVGVGDGGRIAADDDDDEDDVDEGTWLLRNLQRTPVRFPWRGAGASWLLFDSILIEWLGVVEMPMAMVHV